MVSWLAGKLALPRPVALGTLGVRVMVERTVGRGSDEEEEEGGAEGEIRGVLVGKGGAAEEDGVDVGELRLDEDGDDLAVPLDWVWF